MVYFCQRGCLCKDFLQRCLLFLVWLSTSGIAKDAPEWFDSLQGCVRSNEAVEKMYNGLPYPPRSAEEEKKRAKLGVKHLRRMDTPASISHFLYGGTYDFYGAAAPFSILVAGGGTGDPTIMLARTFANAKISAQITHLEVAFNSLQVARDRIKTYGHEFKASDVNIHFVHGSLLDEKLDLKGPFDYIHCVGVLHHLDDPENGLRRLAGQLKPDGGIQLMVYAPLGRTGVYPFQQMYRLVDTEKKQNVGLARQMLKGLPKSNWLRRNSGMYDSYDLNDYGDSGVSDMLMHPCDRAYHVAELASLLNKANLKIVEFWNQGKYMDLAAAGVPADMRPRIERLAPWQKRAAFVELWRGDIPMHTVFVQLPGGKGSTSFEPLTEKSILCHFLPFMGVRLSLPDNVTELCRVHPEQYIFNFRMDGADHRALPGITCGILNLIDCSRSVGDFYSELQRLHGKKITSTRNAFVGQVDQMYKTLSTARGRFFVLITRPLKLPSPVTVQRLKERKDFFIVRKHGGQTSATKQQSEL